MHTPIELILYHISHIKKLSILMWQQKNYDEIKYTRARKLFLYTKRKTMHTRLSGFGVWLHFSLFLSFTI